MKFIIILPVVALLILFTQNGVAQSPDPLNSGMNPPKSKQLKSNKSKGKPLVKKEKAPRKKLFGNRKSEKVPHGYALDNRETGPKSVTDNPNAKQMLPKSQQKKMAAMKKKNKKAAKSSK